MAMKNFRLILLNPAIDQCTDDDSHAVINQLETVSEINNKFNDVNECVKFITDICNEKVFIIIMNYLDEKSISDIHNQPQIDSILIYAPRKAIVKDWIETWPKIKDIFQQDTELIKSLKRTIRQYDENSIPISIIKPSTDLDRNFDQLDPTFIYTQMLKEILLEVKYHKQSINDMATYLRQFYANNESVLNKITNFKQEYKSESAILWYTREVFIYSTLNKALRNLEANTIIQMGIFIRDLDLNIKSIYKKQDDEDYLNELDVYRGQCMIKEDFQKIQQSQGGLLSFNNFLSTSVDSNVALMYAQSDPKDSNSIGVLFHMKISRSSSSTHYGYIADISQFDKEYEILFSMHTIFRIGTIEQLDKSGPEWKVNLTITNDTDQDLKVLAEHLRNETKQATGWLRLVPLLTRLGEFKKAHELCQRLLQSTSDIRETVSIYGQLGIIHDNLSDSRQAISWYNSALEIISRLNLSDKKSLAVMLNNIGLAYKNLDQRKNALLYLEKSLEIYKNASPSNQFGLGCFYNNLGTMYNSLGEQLKALDFFKEAIKSDESLPPNHPDLAMTYKNMAGLYNDMSDFPQALDFIKKALVIEEKTLPKDHPTLNLSYCQKGNILRNLGDYSDAMTLYKNALKITKIKHGELHIDVIAAYGNISLVYLEMGEYKKAISKSKKGIKIASQLFDEHNLLAAFNNIIGIASCHLKNYADAFSFCQKSLNFFKKTPHSNPLDLANVYICVGGIHMACQQRQKALEYFRKGRIIQEQVFPPDHPHLANTYANIGGVYNDMGDSLRALFFCGKGLIIRQKKLPSAHPVLFSSYMSVVQPLIMLHQSSEARLACEKALHIAQRALPVGNEERQLCEKTYKLLTVCDPSSGNDFKTMMEFLLKDEF